MKRLDLYIDKKQAAWLMGSIRTKEDLILVLMNTIKLILIGNDRQSTSESYAQITILKSRMSRLFFSIENKIFTFNFPFQIDLSDSENTRIYHGVIGDIDSQIVSDVMSALHNNECLKQECAFDFLSAIENNIENTNFWAFFKDLLTFEDGYLRYDYDNSSREDPEFHPLNHLDIFYSNSNTFKLGLNQRAELPELFQILNHEDRCRYID